MPNELANAIRDSFRAIESTTHELQELAQDVADEIPLRGILTTSDNLHERLERLDFAIYRTIITRRKPDDA